MTKEQKLACAKTVYKIHPKLLPLSCPTKEMIVWNAHPKVYLPIEKTGEVLCPYCGARYILRDD
jgi:uncharacterized Zn-finger protein